MPELPEVETIRRVLEAKVGGRVIRGAVWRAPATTACRLAKGAGPDPEAGFRALIGRRIQGVRRRAKYLLLDLSGPDNLVVHLGMTGQLFAGRPGESPAGAAFSLPDAHTHLELELSGGLRLYFRDIRKFGQVRLCSAREEERLLGTLGPEPLSSAFTAETLRAGLRDRSASIKSLLLNQRLVAGLGNIYVDEALFRARIAPQTPGRQLNAGHAGRLHQAVRRVLAEAIRFRGTTLSDYFDPESRRGGFQERLRVYGQTGQPCTACGRPIRRGVVAQRGTHWCPACQPRERRGSRAA